jgi:exopolyphosphatase/guanosine-5'-triphosphate,3'-diphosphate pyrophosphatase
VAPPPVRTAVAVGGSAASLRRLVGAVLEPETLQRALRVLSEAPAAEVARRFDLDAERVKLLPAGILALDAAAQVLGQPLWIGRGGLREGVLLDLSFHK